MFLRSISSSKNIMSFTIRCNVVASLSLRRIQLYASAAARRNMASLSLPDGLRRIQPGTLPSNAYNMLVADGVLRPDEYQRSVLPLLDTLHANVTSSATSLNQLAAAAGGGENSGVSEGGGFFASLFGEGRGGVNKSNGVSIMSGRLKAPKGIYLHGGTGCGKTLLLDIFVACAPRAARARRVHFHAFMRDIHTRLHAERQKGVRGDLLLKVASGLIRDAGWLLCFDEVQVTDVGDALILRRLFDALYANGLVMLATSNRAPNELYANGLQRELFLPFIDTLKMHCDVRELASPTDHRLLATQTGGAEGPWIAPAKGLLPNEYSAALASASIAFERAWLKACISSNDGINNIKEASASVAIEGAGRSLFVPRAVGNSVARFSFDDLCRAPLYAGDFAALAASYSHVFIENVPVLNMNERNELRRLVTLIDVLYDSRVRMTVTAAAAPEDLFDGGGGENIIKTTTTTTTLIVPKGTRQSVAGSAGAQYDEVYAWDRAVSRLIDMSGTEYKASCEAEIKAKKKTHKSTPT